LRNAQKLAQTRLNGKVISLLDEAESFATAPPFLTLLDFQMSGCCNRDLHKQVRSAGQMRRL
jgi:hypothetical protein